MNRQWSEEMYGMFGRNVIIDSLDELIGEGLITREPYKMFGKDTFQYYLNYQELNRRLKQLPEKALDKLSPQKDAFISKREKEDTRLLVNGKAFTNKPVTRLLVNEDAFTSNHNVDSTQIHNTASTERENAPTLSRASLFATDKQRRIDTLYCHHYTRQPKVTEKLTSDYDKLAPYVHTQEDMDNLIEFAENRITGDDPVAHPGNLVGNLDAWKLKKKSDSTPLPWSSPDETPESEEPDVLMHAGKPLSYWTEETMQAAELSRNTRKAIRHRQAEWQEQTAVGNC